MSEIMKGAHVAAAMKEDMQKDVEYLRNHDISPCLGMIRVGARPDDLSYERGAKKRMESLGIECKVIELSQEITQQEFEQAFWEVNNDPKIHGVLLFRPIPDHLNEEPVKAMIAPLKDVDCMSATNIAKVFMGNEEGHSPCTAAAVIEMLDFYKINVEGKKVVIIGRSMVVGRPLSMLLLKKHATVTVCHTKTKELEKICREADVLVAAAGQAKMVTEHMVGPKAVVIDVGINVDEEGKLCGDVEFEGVEKIASYISSVPGGVGGITSSILAKHVIYSAKNLNQL